MNTPPQDSAGQSRLDVLIADYLSQVDDSIDVDVNELLKPYPDLAEEFHAYLLNAKLADVIAAKESQSETQASLDTTPSMAVDETLASRPTRLEYADDLTHKSNTDLATDVDEPLPRKFGHYQLQRLLGRGAMGSVYLANDARLNRQIALKIPKFAGSTAPDRMLERFSREARAAAAIEHPNICPVYEVGEHDGKSFIAMMYITGKTLGDSVRGTQGLSPRVAIAFVRKIALALAEAHERGIIHRDLKPSNLMVNQRNEPIVMDFGLAREIHNEGQEKLTQDGTIIGTPTYMSPEQVDGVQSNVGAASDIYSLGVVFYELLTGQVPFTGTILSIMHQIASKQPPRPSSIRPGISPAIEAVCLRMMAKQPGQRYASMHEVAETLAGLLQTEPTALAAGSAPITAAQLKAQSDQVHALIKASEWPDAERLLMQMEGNESPIAANYAKWATEQLVTVRKTLAQQRQQATTAFQQAQSLMKQHDYAGATGLLSRIPASVRTPACNSMLHKAVESQTQVDALFKQIQQNLQTRLLNGTLQHLQRLLELKPNDLVAQYLFRKYKWQSRFGLPAGWLADALAPAKSHTTRPTYEEPLLRKWIGIATLVFALFTIGTAAAITIYIKQNGKQKVAIRVTDEALAKGDVEIVVDGSGSSSQEQLNVRENVSDALSNPEPRTNLNDILLPPFTSERDAANWVIEQGGLVQCKINDGPHVGLKMPTTEKVTNINIVNSLGAAISPSELSRLRSLPHLRRLSLAKQQLLTKDHMRMLSLFRPLEAFLLESRSVSNVIDADVAALLASNPSLKEFWLMGVGIDGSCFDSISNPDFETLIIGSLDETFQFEQYPKLTIESIESLQRLTKLKSFWLVKASLSKEHLRAIGKLHALESLNLNLCTGIQGNIDQLSSLTRLRSLNLGGVALDKNDVSALQKMTSLERIALWGEETSDELKSQLRTALPNCQIFMGDQETMDQDTASVSSSEQSEIPTSVTPLPPFASEKEAANWVIEHGGRVKIVVDGKARDSLRNCSETISVNV